MANRKQRRAEAAQEKKPEPQPQPQLQRTVTPDVDFACRTFMSATPNAQVTLAAIGKIADALQGFKIEDVRRIVAMLGAMVGPEEKKSE